MGSVTTSYSKEIQTLCNLGLTLQQAKVYLALAKIGQATIKDLSEATNINRGDCYRIVSQLIEKRLISKLLTSPARFEVIYFNITLNNLLEKKKEEISALKDNIEKLLEKVKPENRSVLTQNDEESTRFVPISPALIQESKRRFSSDLRSIDILTEVYRCESIQGVFYKEEKKALQRGVKFRMIISDPKGTFDLKRLPYVRRLMKEKGFSLRIIEEEIAAPLSIHDEVVSIFISKETHISKSSPIITNNERMVKLSQGYFDGLWNRAREVKLQTSS
jgi:sugar-specific transcriptional regulator TrmB